MNPKKEVVAGRYRLLRELARGGMGSVHEAVHLVSQRKVALKRLFRSVTHDEIARLRFLREASAPAQIGHQGIVAVYDAGTDDDGELFVAMELLEGMTLRARLKQGPVDEREAVAWVLDLLDALAAAHERGYVHRDLKPENVFLVPKSGGGFATKLLDFGVARKLAADAQALTGTGAVIGTPHYMSPEQALSSPDVVASADVWSVGVILYECLLGVPPFEGHPSGVVLKIVSSPHVPLAVRSPTIRRSLSDLVDRCLEKEPEKRPADAHALRSMLADIATSLAVPVPPLRMSLTSAIPAAPTPPSTGPESPRSPSSGSSRDAPTAVRPGAARPALDTEPVAAAPTQAPADLVTVPEPPRYASLEPEAPSLVTAPMARAGDTLPQVTVPPMPPAMHAEGSKGLRILFAGVALGAVVTGILLYVIPRAVSAPTSDPQGTSGVPAAPIAPAGGAATVVPVASAADTVVSPADEHRRGTLSAGDDTLRTGEYMDTHRVVLGVGDRIRARLHGTGFDPYLMIRQPGGGGPENNDGNPPNTDAVLDFVAKSAGEHRVLVTSSRPGEVGDYDLALTITRVSP